MEQRSTTPVSNTNSTTKNRILRAVAVLMAVAIPVQVPGAAYADQYDDRITAIQQEIDQYQSRAGQLQNQVESYRPTSNF